MRSTIVGQTCAEIADCHELLLRGEMSREDFETKKTELKKRLPAFCFHAHFKNGRRLSSMKSGSKAERRSSPSSSPIRPPAARAFA